MLVGDFFYFVPTWHEVDMDKYMSVSRIKISLSDEDLDLLERKSTDMGMTKSSYVKYLMLEHENKVPDVYKYKDLIAILSDINTTMNEILISKSFDISKQLFLETMIKDFNVQIKKYI